MKFSTRSEGNKCPIMITALAVIIILLIVSFYAFYIAMEAETDIRYMGVKKVVSEKLTKTVSGMEMNAMNVFDEVGKHLDSPESVIVALESKTSLNPDVRGYFAAFEPAFFPEKGKWYEPYVHQDDSTGFKVTQVGSARHDYLKSDWYIRAKKSNESFWSDPYYYQDNPKVASGLYCTFVKPVFDSEGRLACVCGADMTLAWLAKELKRIDKDCKNDDILNAHRMFRNLDYYSMIFTNDGTCIAHPEGKRMPIKDEGVLRDIAQKKSGVIDMMVNGVSSRLYYAPLESIDWTVGIVVPNADNRKPLILVGMILLTIAVIGMIVIWNIIRRNRKDETG